MEAARFHGIESDMELVTCLVLSALTAVIWFGTQRRRSHTLTSSMIKIAPYTETQLLTHAVIHPSMHQKQFAKTHFDPLKLTHS